MANKKILQIWLPSSVDALRNKAEQKKFSLLPWIRRLYLPPTSRRKVLQGLGLVLSALMLADVARLWFREQLLTFTPPENTQNISKPNASPYNSSLNLGWENNTSLFNSSGLWSQSSLYENIIRKNIWSMDGSIPPEVPLPELASEEDDGPFDLSTAVESSLPIQVLSTIVHSNPELSMASLAISGGSSGLSGSAGSSSGFGGSPFGTGLGGGGGSSATSSSSGHLIVRTGDLLDDFGKILAIERSRVYLRNFQNRQVEYLALRKDDDPLGLTRSRHGNDGDDDTSSLPFDLQLDTFYGQRNDPNHQHDNVAKEEKYHIDRHALTGHLQDLPHLLQQARAVPVLGNDGQVKGFHLEEVDTDSVFYALGLRAGDTIQSVNGQKVPDMATALQLYNNLDRQKSVEIEIDRGGQKKTLHYSIP